MSPLPNIQQAQYGDRLSLEKLGGYRKTNNPAADVQSIKQLGQGRPAETDPVKLALRGLPQQTQRGAAPSPEEERFGGQFSSLAQLYGEAIKWVKLASRPDAGPLTKSYAAAAIRDFGRLFIETRRTTPFVDGL